MGKQQRLTTRGDRDEAPAKAASLSLLESAIKA